MPRGTITLNGGETAGNGPYRANQSTQGRKVTFTVHGTPIPQGSMSAFVNPRTGRAIITDQKGDRLKKWRTQIADAARTAHNGPPLNGPLTVQLLFLLPRPKNHWREGRFAGLLKPWAPTAHTVKPDLDKLARAALDALTQSAVIHDDAQISTLHANKAYISPESQPGIHITIKETHA